MNNQITSITASDGTVYNIEGNTISVSLPKVKGTAIRSLGDNRIGGYGVVWGSPEQKDSYGEYFTPETDLWLDWIPVKDKILTFDHTMSPLPPNVPADSKRDWIIGHIDSIKADDYGLWVEAILDEHKDWLAYMKQLIDAGVMGYSSEAVSHLCERAPDGWIKSWALCGFGVTHHPAEPLIGKVNLIKRVRELSEVIKFYKSLNATQALEALQSEAMQATETQDGIKSESKPGENNTMADKFAPEAEATLHAFIDAHWNQIKSAIKQEEGEAPAEGGSGDLNSLLMPYAEGLAQLVGISTEEAMADLSAYVASKMATEEAAPEEITPEEMMNATLNIDRDSFAKEVAKHMKPTGAQSHNTPGLYRTKGINQRKSADEKPLAFQSFIKALARPYLPNSQQVLHDYHKSAVRAWTIKAQGIQPDTAGGFLVTPDRNEEIIERLAVEATVANLVRTIPMAKDRIEVPVVTSGATVNMTAENAQITESQMAFGMKTAYAKKMTVLVPVSSELIDDADPDVESVIMEEITKAVAEKLDAQILRGTGTDSELLGLDNITGITQTGAGSNTLSYDDLAQAQERLEDANVRINDRVQWLIDPKGKRIIREIEDSTGRLIFTGGGEGTQMSGRVPDFLLDYRWNLSNSLVPAGTSARKVYLAQWDDVVLGRRKMLEFMASNQAGNAFAYDQTYIRAIARVALLVRHTESVEIITGITGPEVAS